MGKGKGKGVAAKGKGKEGPIEAMTPGGDGASSLLSHANQRRIFGLFLVAATITDVGLKAAAGTTFEGMPEEVACNQAIYAYFCTFLTYVYVIGPGAINAGGHLDHTSAKAVWSGIINQAHPAPFNPLLKTQFCNAGARNGEAAAEAAAATGGAGATGSATGSDGFRTAQERRDSSSSRRERSAAISELMQSITRREAAYRAAGALLAAPPQPAAASPAAPVDAGEPVVSSPASLPVEIFESARHGELQKVVKWLRRNGGLVDALCSARSRDGIPSAFGLLHVAASKDHLEMVRGSC
eukprot:scaffold31611_cov59-Phaeocystis_antarctica.AAC.4